MLCCTLSLQGSGAKDPSAFAVAIAKARIVCNAGAALGFEMRTVDIGGGYVSCGEPGGAHFCCAVLCGCSDLADPTIRHLLPPCGSSWQMEAPELMQPMPLPVQQTASGKQHFGKASRTLTCCFAEGPSGGTTGAAVPASISEQLAQQSFLTKQH